MKPKPSNSRLSRRDFIMLAAAGSGGLAWFLFHPEIPQIAGKVVPTSTSTALPTDVPATATEIPEPTSTPMPIPTQGLTLNQKRAVDTYQAMQQHYGVSGSSLFTESINPKDDKKAVYLWPFSGVVASVIALTRLKTVGSAYLPELNRVLTALEGYFDSKNNPPAYQSYILADGGGTRFYDDNEWIGLLFVDTYRALKQKTYLDKAIESFNYCVSGWDDTMGGGIYWREYSGNLDHRTKNTCSNAPAAVMALQLYQETKDEKYMQWAQRLISWMQRLKDPDTGNFWDNIDAEGFIDKRQFTYNSGSMLHAYSILYEISQDKKHLNEARALAEATYKYYPVDYTGSGVTLYLNDPWFNTVLLRGFKALYSVDPDKNTRYLEHMGKNLDYAWEKARTSTGLFAHNWQGPALATTKKFILDSAAMVENYAIISQFDKS